MDGDYSNDGVLIHSKQRTMDNNYFTISDLVISGSEIPIHVADKILQHHIIPMNKVRHSLGMPVWASQKSGYRPPAWEYQHGRNGGSQHCFVGLGAVDWTWGGQLETLKGAIINHTKYTRIAVYPDANFIHCDYKANDGNRYIYVSDNKSQWKLATTIKLPK